MWVGECVCEREREGGGLKSDKPTIVLLKNYIIIYRDNKKK